METNDKDLDELLEEYILRDQRDTLDPMMVDEGIERYLKTRSGSLRSTTIGEYEKELLRLQHHLEKNGIQDLNNVRNRDLDDYFTWRREDSYDTRLSTNTMRDVRYIVRDFIRYAARIDAVKYELPDKISIPKLADGEGVRDVEIDPERLQLILDQIEKRAYATREHVVWALFAETGRRLGCIHSLDRDDAHLEAEHPFLEFRHELPETSLKNGTKGEMKVNISESLCTILDTYLTYNRKECTTENGRSPLLTTPYGRLAKSTMRKYVYKWSRPCFLDQASPDEHDSEGCGPAASRDKYSKCPGSHSPHDIRHTYLTECLRDGIPVEALSERCDVTREILEKHYDERTPEEKRDLRRRILEEAGANRGAFSQANA
jgi:site-specific recombinase XerD